MTKFIFDRLFTYWVGFGLVIFIGRLGRQIFSYTLAVDYTNKSHPKPWKVRYYPKNTLFKKGDLIDKGCIVFIDQCPKQYKSNEVCGRHYNGHFKTFNNYCDLEYENCNSWRQWSMIKQSRC